MTITQDNRPLTERERAQNELYYGQKPKPSDQDDDPSATSGQAQQPNTR